MHKGHVRPAAPAAATADSDVNGTESVLASSPAPSLGVTLPEFNAWVSRGEWGDASVEVWPRLSALTLRPDADTFLAVIQVMMVSQGGKSKDKMAQRALSHRLDALWAQMSQGKGPAEATGPLRFHAVHYTSLLDTCRRLLLSAEASKWARRAREAGLWSSLPIHTQMVARTIDKWSAQSEQAMRDSAIARARNDAAEAAVRVKQQQERQRQQQEQEKTAQQSDAAARTSPAAVEASAASSPKGNEAAPSAAAPIESMPAAAVVEDPLLAAAVSSAVADKPYWTPVLPAASTAPSAEVLSKLTVVQLKAQLSAKGLKMSGLKAELVKRLLLAAISA